MAISGHFRTSVWDPPLLVAQIIAVQCLFYVGAGAMLMILDVITGQSVSLDQLFAYDVLHVKDAKGRCIVGAFILNSLFSAIALWFIVQRAKLCLDFSGTVHFYHMLCCWGYNGGVPSTISWWLLNAVCVTVMCVCGEFLCIRTEMKAIPLSMGAKADV